MVDPKPDVSFLGLGAMGFGMATNLLQRGYRVTGFDVHAPTLERFASAGGSTATSPAAAVATAPLCICMVATAQQAQSVLVSSADAAALALPSGAVIVLCSTVPAVYVQGLATELASPPVSRPDLLLVDAPVSGGAARAANGTLSIMAGGTDEAIVRARVLLAAMADPARLYITAGGVGSGSNMKMVHQVLAACQVLAASEAMGFAIHLGLDPRAVGEAVVRSSPDYHEADEKPSRPGAWSWMFENRLPRMLHPEFQPVASALTIIIKDTGIITAEARRCGFVTPMTSTAEQVLLSWLGKGYGPSDDSSLVRLYTEGKGKVGPVQGLTATDETKMALVMGLLEGIHLCAAAESLAFAHRVGLHLSQVLDLCVNAAGGSTMLEKFGPDVIRTLQSSSRGDTQNLEAFVMHLLEAVEEAQRLKVPLYLGSQALILVQTALAREGKGASPASVVKIWTP